ncbi:hypothetical protein PCY14_09105 [Streptococcus sp. SV2]|jgi:hypothetical protein|uniref:hypothetical protein n=1 Tax=unclassified Streptococcus TaxID=2608887 RepID=UPI0025D0B5B5|nr:MULTISPECIES: hypothetical protein [unclassified Streptococcus]MBS5424941.1 hypothetical protein [Streptococcus sp.]MBS6932148.1 hypothetical protein [Streptococcus sp.]MDN5031359.1 hypothetical protein [Streptococcus sp. SV1]MDN5041561.1 hypothetical protein [Streptococcus sp. SV2]MDU5661893.1 hypothetical protein [Streptococcus sp.]
MKMKDKVIRVCSLVLLSVAVSASLVGCGSKSEKDTAASSTTSTSKVVKSSAKTKASEKKSAKKSKTEDSSSKDSQGQEEASTPEASSSKNQATAGNDAQSGASSSAVSDSNKSSQTTRDSQSDTPVPAALVGTWTGTSPQATDISFTVDANGNVTSKANFNVDYEPYRQSSTTAKAVQISGNLYVWEGGDFSTLLPGITGLGGAGFQAKPGFILENGTYTPVQFISDLGPSFDYSNYKAFPFSLTK